MKQCIHFVSQEGSISLIRLHFYQFDQTFPSNCEEINTWGTVLNSKLYFCFCEIDLNKHGAANKPSAV